MQNSSQHPVTPGRTRGRGGGVAMGDGCHPSNKLFQNFEKSIYSKGLKLSVAVHSSFADILICQLCVHPFLCFHSNRLVLCRFVQKSTFLT